MARAEEIVGRVSVITGAASGIGAATARRLSRRPNAEIWLVDQDADSLQALDLDDRHPRLVADVTEPDWFDRYLGLMDPSKDWFEALIACAGVSCAGSVVDNQPERWRRVLEVNSLGLMYSVRAAASVMVPQGRGTIVALASISGTTTYVGEPAYVASKHAVVGFCDSVRQELAGSGVRVSIVEPGFVDTPLTRGDPELARRMQEVTPLRPDDVARMIEFIVEQPANCNVSEVRLRPSEQRL